MKKLILLLALTLVVFSCSKDTIDTETTADLTQTTLSKSLDQPSDGMYYGVFGHNSNKEMHGKININANHNGEYSAQINLINGEVLSFIGNGLNNQKLHFTGDRGSFDFDISDSNNAKASNVFIDQETEAYIETRRGVGIVILGAYEETGNEANFYGNWDIFITEIITSPVNGNNQNRGGGGGDYIFDATVVSHKGNRGPFIDTSFEFIDDCEFSGQPPLLVNIPGDGSWFDIWCDDQVSMLAGYQSDWDLLVVPGWHGDYVNYFSDDNGFPCTPAAAGTWSWAGRSGIINLLNYIPVPPAPTNDGNSRAVYSHSPYTK